MSRAELLAVVPRNIKLAALLDLIRDRGLGSVEYRHGTGEVLIRLKGRAGSIRMSACRRDAGKVLVSAVRRVLELS